MTSSIDCIPCVFSIILKVLKATDLDDQAKNQIMRDSFEAGKELLETGNAPLMLGKVLEKVRERTGQEDPFYDFKRRSTSIALTLLPKFREQVKQAENPLLLALKISVAANGLDLVAIEESQLDQIAEELAVCDEIELQGEADQLSAELDDAREIFIIGDNAGEVVFDLLILEQLEAENIYYGVRGYPVLNDATEVEALEAGVYRWAEIISNDSYVPGTVLTDVSEQFLERFNSADLVLAKGQGNYESLRNSPRELYNLFKIKCQPVADELGYKLNDYLLMKQLPNKNTVTETV